MNAVDQGFETIREADLDRRVLVRRFPSYSICYRNDAETFTVYTVFHGSQDPEKWLS